MAVLSTTLLVGLCSFMLTVWFVRRRNMPPGPWSLPLIGYRFGGRPSHEIYQELSRRYGPIFSVRRGPYLTVVLNDKLSIRQALVKNGDAFSDRFVPKYILEGIPDKNKSASIVWSSGKSWSDLRKFGLVTLRAFGMGKKSLEPQINLEAKYLGDEIEATQGKPIEILQYLNKATSNIICQLVFGKRLDYDDVEYQKVVDSITRLFTSVSDSIELRTDFQKAKKFIFSEMHRHRDTFQKSDIRSMVDAFIAHDVISQVFTFEEFWRVLLDFFAAGLETTSVTLSWIILYMITNQDLQQKVQAELDNVVGRGRQPTLSDRENLPFCEATILEVMRLSPILPNLVPHKTSCDVSLSGYTIPKGTIVIPNIWAVHHDSKEWINPEEFKPQRFLSDDGKTVVKSDAWMPFGVGRRECLGFQLAKMELFLFFTNLFQRFVFRIPPGQTQPSFQGVGGFTTAPTTYQTCAAQR
ncbi:cytochrome P450 2J2-like [Diadema antillarum]|uniref:cytochrome P450 2J2-like n=1 Tax=Diadema antillarum TaxID=105358 RepID=UPI003A8888DA